MSAAKSLSWLTALLPIAGVVEGAAYPPLQYLGKRANSSLCLTPVCIHAASELLYSFAPNYKTIDPCTKFDELVCGGWRERHDMRADQNDIWTGTFMAESSSIMLKHILEEGYPDSNSSSAAQDKTKDKQNFDQMKALYDSCMNEAAIKQAGPAPLLQMVRKVVELFPASGNGSSTKNLPATMQYIKSISVGSFVGTGTGTDDKYPDSVAVYVSAPGSFGLSANERYANETIVTKYKAVISQILSSLLADQHVSNTTFAAVADFEAALVKIAPSQEDRRDITKTYNVMSLNSTSALIPQVGLTQLINSRVPSNVTVTSVIVNAPQYFKNLSGLLSNTSSDVLQSYFVWKVFQSYYANIDPEFTAPWRRFQNELAGRDPDSKSDRWRTCVSLVDNNLGWTLSRFFVEKSFSPQAKEFGDRIVSDIRNIFIEKLKSKPWIEKEVLDAAIRKVNNIVQKIGYPTKSPNILDSSSIQNYYRGINITAADYFANIVSITKWSLDTSWNKLGKPVNRDEWEMTAPTVNAYYSPSGNEIVFPAGIMQDPLFNVELPEYMSYGSFGSIAGHELSHAFDNSGRHYDETGKYADWWTNTTIVEFEKRANCFIDEYANFTVEGPDGQPLHVNGRFTQGENIADAGGVSASYAAWQRRAVAEPGLQQDLPGMDFFTHEQMFFVNYASSWCGKARKESAINRIYTDPHSPNWARILGTLANSRGFRESFKCAVKEPTCELW